MNLATPAVDMPLIRGMQGQTWSETIRTDDQYYQMAFPRTLAVAERAWHRASWELDWSPGVSYNMTTDHVPKDELEADYNDFVSVLGCRETTKLKKLGIKYRVPPPGGSIDAAGMLSANSELPCTSILYSTDQGGSWLPYPGPVNVGPGKVVQLKSTSADGSLESRVIVASEGCVDCFDNLSDSPGNELVEDIPATLPVVIDATEDTSVPPAGSESVEPGLDTAVSSDEENALDGQVSENVVGSVSEGGVTSDTMTVVPSHSPQEPLFTNVWTDSSSAAWSFRCSRCSLSFTSVLLFLGTVKI